MKHLIVLASVALVITAAQPEERREAEADKTDEADEKFYGLGGLGGYNPYYGLGYQPGSGYGGANVQFTNIGPLGRPALSYHAPGISIDLRDKQIGRKRREADKTDEADEKFYGLGGLGGYNPYYGLGYQPGSGYGGANVQFTNIGPLGRPALSYHAPGISIDLRDKQTGRKRREADKTDEADEKFYGLGGLGGYNPYYGLGYQPGSGYGGANVQFTNIGPLGRPALSYHAPGISIDLRDKQTGRKRREADKTDEADEKFYGLGGYNPYYGLGYQPGSGYGGASVQFTNIGPLGRPALSYHAPGISIDLRDKQTGRKKRETPGKNEEASEKFYGFQSGVGGFGNGFNPHYGHGYQPGSGYGGANVQFSNIGPLGRPALDYNAPGFSISLRDKETGR